MSTRILAPKVVFLAALVPLALGLMVAPAAAATAERSTSPVLTLPPPSPSAVGSSTLVRTDNGISANLRTSGLEPGHAVTLWWVVFNDPDSCEAGLPGLSQCGPDDAHYGRGGVSPNHATGHVVDDDGTGGFGAHLRVGDTSRALAGPGLVNPRGAEVILVLKSHGPKIDDLVSDQLRTFAGGCADQSDAPPGTPAELLGERGPNDCAEIQFSAHSPA
ncbi:MAG: hypothetical protein ACRDQ7_13260 [Haloechinothrix sp.]